MNHAAVDTWLAALDERHVAPWRPIEFTKALRALSVRYVERRGELPDRSPLDSAGKRAAFAAFYAPLHFLVVARIVAALPDRARRVTSVTDLGCGTGVGAAAWALSADPVASVAGVDTHAWALEEAAWNWRTLGLSGRARRGDLTGAVPSAHPGAGLICAWSVNEVSGAGRATLLPGILTFVERGGVALVIEPLAKGVTPWWPEWTGAFERIGGRADEWKFPPDLPARLRERSQRAGFRRESLGARSLVAGL